MMFGVMLTCGSHRSNFQVQLIMLPPFVTICIILLLKFRTLAVFQQPIYNQHQGVLPKGRSFTANSGTMSAVLSKGRSSTANSGTKVTVLLVMNRCGSFPFLLHYRQQGYLKLCLIVIHGKKQTLAKLCVLFFALQNVTTLQ